ncbi:MAG: phosphoglycerate kinase [Lactobacillales bacterium]|jgi:phosphoglycerate kinase|nr:phosphoglycerate kinase [Lactobacillales bacterium]
MHFKTLDDFDFGGKTVFVRADLNVPAKEGKITDTTRIDRFVPTLKEIVTKGGKVVIASHYGRPDGQKKPEFSMAFLVPALEKASGLKVTFCDDCIGTTRDEMIRQMNPGDVILLENLRFHPGEEENDRAFAEQLTSGIDIYIDDAFSTAHRAHASTEGVAHLLPRGAGRLMQEELEALDKALGNPERPAVALVGGSKVSTKLDLLANLVKKVDYLCIGGGMAHTFLAAKGIPMGKGSLVETGMIDTAKNILANAGNCVIVLPADLTWADEFGEGQTPHVSDADKVPAGKVLMDIGPKTVAAFVDVISKCKTLIWNGPVGAFEIKPFDKCTNEIAAVVSKLTKEGKLISVAGGGDTVSALKKAGVEPDLTYVSAAGGAFLEWMEGKTLPGVAILEK